MYDRYFGFPESPFRVTPDPRFFYSNAVYEEAYAILRYGIEARKGFTVITGEVGTGKTTMLRRLMRNLGDTIHSVFIFNTYLNFSELLQLIHDDLGLASKQSNRVTLIHELNDYLLAQLKRDHVVAVLIDEAQNLSAEALEGLRLLSNLETDQEKLIQIVLMGQPELEAKLDQPSLRQLKERVALRCRLLPLMAEEVGPYIDARLRAAGYEGTNPFHRDAVQEIAEFSRGLPRLINIICDNALVTAFAGSQKIVSAKMIKEVAGDLRLGPGASAFGVGPAPEVVFFNNTPVPHVGEGSTELAPFRTKRIARAGMRTLLIIFGFVAVASVFASQGLLGVSGRDLASLTHNLKRWVATSAPVEREPQRIGADSEPQPKGNRVVIQRGAAIEKVAYDAYGANAILGMDLIKEFNPNIKNLNRVFPGQDLLLPPLTRETLLRKQRGGSYHLIAASFRSRTGAGSYARRLSEKGYKTIITSSLIADDLSLHRVEIGGLKNFEEAMQTWEAGLRNQWLAFADSPRDGRDKFDTRSGS
jgi:type II secretory pathway predicted ATPase ExeA